MNLENTILPLGTICDINNYEKKIMIIGFNVKEEKDSDEVFDYLVCNYPEGLIDSNHFMFCNKEDIKDILYMGYSNEETLEFQSLIQKLNNNNEEKIEILEMPKVKSSNI